MHVHATMSRFDSIELMGIMILAMTIALLAVAIRYMLRAKESP